MTEAYARPPADPVTVSPAVWDWQRTQLGRSLEWLDLVEELCEASEGLMVAIKTDDPALIGRVVLAVRDAYLDRLVDRELETGAALVSAEDAARMVLLAASVERAKAAKENWWGLR